RLAGYITQASPLTFGGNGTMPDGSDIKWTATYTGAAAGGPPNHKDQNKPDSTFGLVIYPFTAYGSKDAPRAEAVLFKNATVWTNEKEGILQNTDVLIENGKIKAVGKNLSAGNARGVDATGKDISAGVLGVAFPP